MWSRRNKGGAEVRLNVICITVHSQIVFVTSKAVLQYHQCCVILISIQHYNNFATGNFFNFFIAGIRFWLWYYSPLFCLNCSFNWNWIRSGASAINERPEILLDGTRPFLHRHLVCSTTYELLKHNHRMSAHWRGIVRQFYVQLCLLSTCTRSSFDWNFVYSSSNPPRFSPPGHSILTIHTIGSLIF